MMHTPEMRNEIAAYVTGQLDEGFENGRIEFQTTQGECLVTLVLSKPAFAPPVDGVSTANFIEPGFCMKSGTVTKASFKNGKGQEKFVCSVTAFQGGGDIELSAVRIPAGMEVGLEFVTYIAPL